MFGLIAAAATFVAFSPETFSRWPWVITLAKFITVGGLAGIGLTAKDSGVTNSAPGSTVEARNVPDAPVIPTPPPPPVYPK